MTARWVPAFIARIALIAAVLTAEAVCQYVLADELMGVAKDFVGHWQAAPDLIYEFSAAGKFRILRDPSKQPAGELRWTLPPNTVSCTVEGYFTTPRVNADDTPYVYLGWTQQTTEQRLPDGKLQSSTEKFPPSPAALSRSTTLYFLSKSDTPQRTITVTTSRPVSDREVAIVIGAMDGDILKQTMDDKQESEKNTRTWTRLGD